MGCCFAKASAKDETCPELELPQVTFNVIENPVVSAPCTGADGSSLSTIDEDETKNPAPAKPTRPPTPLPPQMVHTSGKEHAADEGNTASKGHTTSDGDSDSSSDQAWEQVA